MALTDKEKSALLKEAQEREILRTLADKTPSKREVFGHPGVRDEALSAIVRDTTSKRQVKLQSRQLKFEQARFGVSMLQRYGPLIFGGLALLIFTGPAIGAITKIIQSLNLWIWGAIILVAILMWRQRK